MRLSDDLKVVDELGFEGGEGVSGSGGGGSGNSEGDGSVESLLQLEDY